MAGAIRIQFEMRGDGGIRIWSDDMPGLVLSGRDPAAVWSDLGPVIAAMLKHNN